MNMKSDHVQDINIRRTKNYQSACLNQNQEAGLIYNFYLGAFKHLQCSP